MKSTTTPDRDVGSSDSSAARCPKCNGIGYHVRVRYFETEDADVWECQSPLCTSFGLLWHTPRAKNPWQSRETAPDNRTRVLAAHIGVYEPCSGSISGKRFFPDGGSGSEPFTHWMPIPSLPNKQISNSDPTKTQ